MRTWFYYGFVLMCSGLVYSLMTFAYQANRSELMSNVTHCIGIIQITAIFIWMIVGTVVRFSDTGEVCSGSGTTVDSVDPFMEHTGRVMQSVLVLMYVLFGLMFCCGCCAGTFIANGYLNQH